MGKKKRVVTWDTGINREHRCEHCWRLSKRDAIMRFAYHSYPIWLHHACYVPWFEKWYGRTCRICGQHFYVQWSSARRNGYNDLELCFTCWPHNTDSSLIGRQVTNRATRTAALGLLSSLTVGQWQQTLSDFNNRCAYCQSRPATDIEHFIPVELGGGTTADNCVPSCRACNARKRSKHPNDLDDSQWHGRISQIRTYLSTRNA